MTKRQSVSTMVIEIGLKDNLGQTYFVQWSYEIGPKNNHRQTVQ